MKTSFALDDLGGVRRIWVNGAFGGRHRGCMVAERSLTAKTCRINTAPKYSERRYRLAKHHTCTAARVFRPHASLQSVAGERSACALEAVDEGGSGSNRTLCADVYPGDSRGFAE